MNQAPADFFNPSPRTETSMGDAGAAEVTAPIAPAQRLEALDLLRGVAILGIFVVNMAFFAAPFWEAVYPSNLDQWGATDRAAHLGVKVFFEFKFVSMFSLLFGAGLVMQASRARGGFAGRYFRRIALLAVFGAVHAVLLWFGDILFIYAVIGSILFFFRNLQPRTLLIVATCILVATAVLGTTCAGIQWLAKSAAVQQENSDTDTGDIGDAPDPGEVASGDASSDAALEPGSDALTTSEEAPLGIDAMVQSMWQPSDSKWVHAETVAYRDGPFLDALAFRVVTWSFSLIFAMFSFGWHILAMFLIGAAFMKLNFFTASMRPMQRRVTVVGLGAGLALEGFNGWITTFGTTPFGWHTVVGTFVHEVGSALLCLGYVGGITMIATAGIARTALAPIRAVGRMALTAYLLTTIITKFLMDHWGLGWFGSLGRAEMMLVVVAVYPALVILCTVWLSVFAIGPFEWLWRTVTYLKAPSFRRVP
jgi:uncharacterized protein